MKPRSIIFILLATGLLFSGCGMSYQMRRLDTGMTKNEVLSILGKPDGKKVEGEYEVLEYNNRCMNPMTDLRTRADYYVILKNGIVVEYGPGEIRQQEVNGTTTLFIVPIR
jgi:hypothetical protein